MLNFAGTPFCKFGGNLFFPQKGGLVHQKMGRSLPLREKRGSRQMYDTKTSRPSFPSVSVGKIPGKYRPIPNRNTKSRCNSNINISYAMREANLTLCFLCVFISVCFPKRDSCVGLVHCRRKRKQQQNHQHTNSSINVKTYTVDKVNKSNPRRLGLI